MPVLDQFPAAVKPAWFNPARLQVDEIKLLPALQREGPEVVGYLRTGGCTAGCGACCEAFVVPIRAEKLADAEFEPVSNGQIVFPIEPNVVPHAGYKDWEYWLTLHEAWMLQMPGGLLVLPIPVQAKTPTPAPLEFGSWMAWLEEHNIQLVQRPGQSLLAYINVPCGALTEDKLCAVFGTDARPLMCRTYPEHPMDVEGIGFCTYRFDPVTRDQVTEVAARRRPQPTPPRKKKRKKKGRR
mgnify:CR=1 FL=1